MHTVAEGKGDMGAECFGDGETCITHSFLKVLFDLVEDCLHIPVADLIRIDRIPTVLGRLVDMSRCIPVIATATAAALSSSATVCTTDGIDGEGVQDVIG